MGSSVDREVTITKDVGRVELCRELMSWRKWRDLINILPLRDYSFGLIWNFKRSLLAWLTIFWKKVRQTHKTK